jgi:signal transduction histidine kinase/CheY-like chemotaxis protein
VLISGKGMRVHVGSFLVLVIGMVASLGALGASRDSVHDTNGQLLRGDTAQASLVLTSLVSTITSPYKQLGSVVTSSGASASVFDGAAGKLASTDGATIALLHDVGGHLTIIASVGFVHRNFGPDSNDELISTLASQPNENFAGMVIASNVRWLEEVYGRGFVPANYVIYSEEPVGKANTVTKLPGVLFPGTQAAAYVGSVSPTHLILQTAKRTPGGPQEALSVVNGSMDFNDTAQLTSHPGGVLAPGHLIVAMSPDTNLAGSFAANFPWILFLFGMGATLIFAGLLSVANGRRVKALGFVGELEATNAELDVALSRQARAELHLRQAQRMEAVGQLAGGIAHDFNNLLQAIISYSEFLSEEIDPDSDMQHDVAEVKKAAHRAADLTRQLLVFSRQEVTKPVVVELNCVVSDTERLLRHTLGEDVKLSCRLSEGFCQVLADAGELELVLMNLAINARDAMPRGGNVWITVDTVNLEACDAQAAGVAPGTYAQLGVTDNGSGMTLEVAAKAFEPFFTTKETGRGTGLGLAMVYGISVRWGGTTSIATVLGVGTTISLLLPLTAEDPATIDEAQAKSRPRGDRNVALLVEDQEGVRLSTARILEAAGFEVIQSESGVQASIDHASSTIDILITDLVMPGGVSGRELADQFLVDRPELPVVFVSGYSADTISERGILAAPANVVKKPFSPEELLEAVNHAMSYSFLVSP